MIVTLPKRTRQNCDNECRPKGDRGIDSRHFGQVFYLISRNVKTTLYFSALGPAFFNVRLPRFSCLDS
jgi:hypothetical protein